MLKGMKLRYLACSLVMAFCCGAATSRAAEANTASKWPNLDEVIVVFKTHFDIGYTDLSSAVVESYRTSMIDQALSVCDDTVDLPPEQQFVWTLSGWPLTQILYPGQTAQRRERLLEAMRAGRIVWHGLPVTMHTESLEREDIARGLRFSSQLSRLVGEPLPRDAKMTDVPSHCRGLVPILANAGIEFLHIGTNRGCRPPDVPLLFWWEGPDGSRVLTMLVLGYGTGLLPPEDWPHKTWLALVHTRDNVGPPTPEKVRAVIAEISRDLPGVNVRLGRLSDFADAIRRESPELPVVDVDMPDTWVHGVMSMPVESGIARRVRPRIGQLELLNTLMKLWGVEGVEDIKQTIADAYEGSLMYGEHTWGMDAKKFPRLYGEAWKAEYAKGTFAKLEQSWAEHGNYIRKTAELVEPAIESHMQKLADAVAVQGRRIVVYNPTMSPAEKQVVVPWPSGEHVVVRDLRTRELIPSQIADRQLHLLAPSLPATGYQTLEIVPAAAEEAAEQPVVKIDPASGIMENDAVRITIDPVRGGIVEFHDMLLDHNWVSSEGALGEYCYERFDADDPKRYTDAYNVGGFSWIPGDFGKPDMPPASEVPRSIAAARDYTMTMTTGPVFARAVLEREADEQIPHDVTLTITLYADRTRQVEVEWSVDNKSPTPWPEAGWLRFPFAIDKPEFLLSRLGGLVDPAKDAVPGSNNHVFCLNGGLSVRDPAGRGAGLIPLDSPLVSLGEPGLWKYSRTFGERDATVYVNLFNNVWATNFAQWIGGSWKSRVRLWPIAPPVGPWDGLLAKGAAARSPVFAAYSNAPAGMLPPTAKGFPSLRQQVPSGFPLSVNNLDLAPPLIVFGPNPDGDGTLLRLWNQGKHGGVRTVGLPPAGHFQTAQPCDLRGTPTGEAIPIKDGIIELTVPAWGVRSVILR